ncbi:hypothetical protein BCR39DRAFT_508463 [Naematelia encephala]|uniref:Uncharacterized protein n=1 Tax=Naematelia encephala TaxID=71784 RepID=A0A1Y2AFF0_9TREE|nr:hypothetical protein BCR39DRAFT_508463 [Naematelia encephala]
MTTWNTPTSVGNTAAPDWDTAASGWDTAALDFNAEDPGWGTTNENEDDPLPGISCTVNNPATQCSGDAGSIDSIVELHEDGGKLCEVVKLAFSAAMTSAEKTESEATRSIKDLTAFKKAFEGSWSTEEIPDQVLSWLDAGHLTAVDLKTGLHLSETEPSAPVDLSEDPGTLVYREDRR